MTVAWSQSVSPSGTPTLPASLLQGRLLLTLVHVKALWPRNVLASWSVNLAGRGSGLSKALSRYIRMGLKKTMNNKAHDCQHPVRYSNPKPTECNSSLMASANFLGKIRLKRGNLVHFSTYNHIWCSATMHKILDS